MKRALQIAAAAVWITGSLSAQDADEQAFQALVKRDWQEVFSDPCTGAWKSRWFLDGEKAVVTSGGEGMTIDTAKGYAVLWTKQDFEGDLRIDYDFLRMDSNDKGVNILYIQATGSGRDGHDEDIATWSDERKDAAMKRYYNNMNTYHISYAAYPNDYVRGRRYMPLAGKGLQGTELTGDRFGTGLFDEPHAWIHVTVLKRPKELFMRLAHPDKTLVCRFRNTDKPPIAQGRIGLRLMPGRMSRFKGFRVWTVR